MSKRREEAIRLEMIAVLDAIELGLEEFGRIFTRWSTGPRSTRDGPITWPLSAATCSGTSSRREMRFASPRRRPASTSLPAYRIDRSNHATSQYLPNLRPTLSNVPTLRKPKRSWSATDAGFGWAMPATTRCTSSPMSASKSAAVQPRADAAADGVRMAVDARLHGRVVGRFRAPAAARRIADRHAFVIGGDNQPVPSRRRVIAEPAAPRGRFVGLQIEGDRGVDDVVVVDRGERRQIVRHGGPQLNRLRHADRILSNGEFSHSRHY